MEPEQNLLTEAAKELSYRYWNTGKETIYPAISHDEFMRNIFAPIYRGDITEDQLDEYCIEQIKLATGKFCTDADKSEHYKSIALYTRFLTGLAYVCEAMKKDLSDKERLSRLLLAVERITVFEWIHPLSSKTQKVEERIRFNFAQKGVHARGGKYAEAKELLRLKLSELHSAEGPLKSIQYALNKVSEAVVTEYNAIPEIKKKMSLDRASKTFREWISCSDMLILFFSEATIQRSSRSKHSGSTK